MDEKILVTRATMPPIEEYIDEIKSIWETRWLTNMGEKHQVLQKELKEYLHVDNIELLVNGHMALELTIQAMNLSGEVITTPFTFASTTHAIVRNGLTPVFCDINEEDYTINVSKIESLITEKTTAIVPVHVYGNICDVEEIERIAKKHHLKVIYDAAHTFGEIYKGKGIGDFGDASCFSFHATKVFNTIEGGAVCYHNNELGKRLYNLKNFGIQGPEQVDGIGANAKMNEFQAAMGICNLRHLEDNLKKRKKIVERYQEGLSEIKGIKVWHKQENMESNYAYFPIVINPEEYGINRDELAQKLEANNIYPRKYFYPITNSFACFHNQFDVSLTPIAEKISKNVLTLPLYPELETEIVDKICLIFKRK